MHHSNNCYTNYLANAMKDSFFIQELTNQYQGFLHGKDIGLGNHLGFSPFLVEGGSAPSASTLETWNKQLSPKLVLGKRVEEFMTHYLTQHPDFDILAKNVQIFDQKRTIGELDFLLFNKALQQYIHLEQVYKFYLYLPQYALKEIDCWVGPNLKDSFKQKLDKLHQKQFPLLYHPTTQAHLETLHIKIENVQQQLSFKATLFVPFSMPPKNFSNINPQCIEGFWLSIDQLQELDPMHQQFYLPSKQNWGVNPANNTTWYAYDFIKELLETQLAQQKAPLCWMKSNQGTYAKFFVVWW